MTTPTISERMATIEERTLTILKAVERIENNHSNHIENCHIAMEPLIKENAKNTTFRQACLWVLTSSGIVTFLGGMAWLGLKTALKA